MRDLVPFNFLYGIKRKVSPYYQEKLLSEIESKFVADMKKILEEARDKLPHHDFDTQYNMTPARDSLFSRNILAIPDEIHDDADKAFIILGDYLKKISQDKKISTKLPIEELNGIYQDYEEYKDQSKESENPITVKEESPVVEKGHPAIDRKAKDAQPQKVRFFEPPSEALKKASAPDQGEKPAVPTRNRSNSEGKKMVVHSGTVSPKNVSSSQSPVPQTLKKVLPAEVVPNRNRSNSNAGKETAVQSGTPSPKKPIVVEKSEPKAIVLPRPIPTLTPKSPGSSPQKKPQLPKSESSSSTQVQQRGRSYSDTAAMKKQKDLMELVGTLANETKKVLSQVKEYLNERYKFQQRVRPTGPTIETIEEYRNIITNLLAMICDDKGELKLESLNLKNPNLKKVLTEMYSYKKEIGGKPGFTDRDTRKMIEYFNLFFNAQNNRIKALNIELEASPPVVAASSSSSARAPN